MISRAGASQLFWTPLLQYKVDDHVALNTALLAEGQRMRANDTGVSVSNKGGWHSNGNIFTSQADCIQKLLQSAHQATIDATQQIKPKTDIRSLNMKISGWMNMNPQGGFNAPHTHPGAHWSGVYYVSQPAVEEGASGMIEFLDPRTDLANWTIFESETFVPKFRVRPAPGTMILFPSYLMHWVHPNESAEERVSIAFNATFEQAQ